MNEIVKAGLVGAAFLSGIALLVVFINWLSKKELEGEIVFRVIMWIFGAIVFIAFSIVVGSVLIAGMK